MKHFYKTFLTLIIAIATTSLGYAGQDVVKTMSLGDGISTSGYVRLVVKLTDNAIGPDIGFTLHETEPAAPWNDAMAIGMFDFVKNANGGIHLAGYDNGNWDWDNNVKAVEKNKYIVLWIQIDAEAQTHGLYAQMEGESTVTTVYEGYGDRESIKGPNTATIAKYCSVFVNNRDGQATSAIEVAVDAEIVDAVTPYDFGDLTTGISGDKALNNSISVYPTLVRDYLNVNTSDDVKTLKVYSITGEMVLNVSNKKRVSMQELRTGAYIVEVETMNNFVHRQKVVKKAY